jgi:hypothetical protein
MSWPRQSLEERFWSRVSPEPNSGCWLWEGATNRGHGKLRRTGGGSIYASHVSLTLHGRPQPTPDAISCHHCDVAECVNPEHLYWGTHVTNTMDAYNRGRRVAPPAILAIAARERAQTHCKWGHEFTSENTYVAPDGRRQCRACQRVNERRLYVPRPRILSDHCKQGHKYTAENTVILKDRRRCRACQQMYERARKARKE